MTNDFRKSYTSVTLPRPILALVDTFATDRYLSRSAAFTLIVGQWSKASAVEVTADQRAAANMAGKVQTGIHMADPLLQVINECAETHNLRYRSVALAIIIQQWAEMKERRGPCSGS